MKKIVTAKPIQKIEIPKESDQLALARVVEQLVEENRGQQQSLVENILLLIEAVSQKKELPAQKVEQPKKIQIEIERDSNGNMKKLHIERVA